MFKKLIDMLKGISESLDSMNKTDEKIASKTIKIAQTLMLIVILLAFIGGVPVIGVVSFGFTMNRALKKAFVGETFTEGWAIMFTTFMVKSLSILIPSVILAGIFPMLGKVLYFSLRW